MFPSAVAMFLKWQFIIHHETCHGICQGGVSLVKLITSCGKCMVILHSCTRSLQDGESCSKIALRMLMMQIRPSTSTMDDNPLNAFTNCYLQVGKSQWMKLHYIISEHLQYQENCEHHLDMSWSNILKNLNGKSGLTLCTVILILNRAIYIY